MTITLLKIGTKHYWRDETTRCYRAVENPAQIVPFDDEAGPAIAHHKQAPDGPTEAPYFCTACGEYFVGACNCQNTPEAHAHRAKPSRTPEP